MNYFENGMWRKEMKKSISRGLCGSCGGSHTILTAAKADMSVTEAAGQLQWR